MSDSSDDALARGGRGAHLYWVGFGLFLVTWRQTVLHLPRNLTMFSRSEKSKRRDVALSTLDGVVQVLSVAKDSCGIPPAQIALGSACVLLSTIKVRSPRFLNQELPVYTYPGHDGQQRRLSRSWVVLRAGMQGA